MYMTERKFLYEEVSRLFFYLFLYKIILWVPILIGIASVRQFQCVPTKYVPWQNKKQTFWLGMKAFYMYIEIDKYFSYHSSETYVVGYSLEGPW